MTRKERLEAVIRGNPVDRPGLSFYEIGGFDINPDNPDPFNPYQSESWRRLIDLAERETDLIWMRSPECSERHPDYDKYFTSETYLEKGSRFTKTTLNVGGKELTSLTRRDPEADTVWTLKHLLSDADDLDAYLRLPEDILDCTWSAVPLDHAEAAIGEDGVVMVDAADPLCIAASLFSMADYTIMALTDQVRFHKLLEKVSRSAFMRTEQTATAFPGHLWRIFGAEYATEPYLPPALFREYVNRYTGPMVETIHRTHGFVRLHCHGRLASALPAIVDLGVDAIDPIEPPGQGDVELSMVAAEYGDVLSLYGNVEVTDIENLEESKFEAKTRRAVEDGQKARGFVLMPTSSPYGNQVPPRTMHNYETMVRIIGDSRGSA